MFILTRTEKAFLIAVAVAFAAWLLISQIRQNLILSNFSLAFS